MSQQAAEPLEEIFSREKAPLLKTANEALTAARQLVAVAATLHEKEEHSNLTTAVDSLTSMVEGSYEGHDFMSDLMQKINDTMDAQMKLQALVGEQDTAKEVETADAVV